MTVYLHMLTLIYARGAARRRVPGRAHRGREVDARAHASSPDVPRVGDGGISSYAAIRGSRYVKVAHVADSLPHK